MSTLREAAQALVDRWDTPLWKEAPHTGVFIDALRAALAQPQRKPLTEKEIYALVDATLEHGRCALARAIERAHGIE